MAAFLMRIAVTEPSKYLIKFLNCAYAAGGRGQGTSNSEDRFPVSVFNPLFFGQLREYTPTKGVPLFGE